MKSPWTETITPTRRYLLAAATVAVTCTGVSYAAATSAHATSAPMTASSAQASSAQAWSVSRAGAHAWGTMTRSGGRIYIRGTIKDTRADKRSAVVQIRFQTYNHPPRFEAVQVGGKGKTKSFSFNSNKEDVGVKACTVRNKRFTACTSTKWL